MDLDLMDPGDPDLDQVPPPVLPKPGKDNVRLQKLKKKKSKKKPGLCQTPVPFRACLSPVNEVQTDLELDQDQTIPPPLRPSQNQYSDQIISRPTQNQDPFTPTEPDFNKTRTDPRFIQDQDLRSGPGLSNHCAPGLGLTWTGPDPGFIKPDFTRPGLNQDFGFNSQDFIRNQILNQSGLVQPGSAQFSLGESGPGFVSRVNLDFVGFRENSLHFKNHFSPESGRGLDQVSTRSEEKVAPLFECSSFLFDEDLHQNQVQIQTQNHWNPNLVFPQVRTLPDPSLAVVSHWTQTLIQNQTPEVPWVQTGPYPGRTPSDPGLKPVQSRSGPVVSQLCHLTTPTPKTGPESELTRSIPNGPSGPSLKSVDQFSPSPKSCQEPKLILHVHPAPKTHSIPEPGLDKSSPSGVPDQSTISIQTQIETKDSILERPQEVNRLMSGLPQVSAELHQASAGLPLVSAGLHQASAGLPLVSAGLHQASAGLSLVSAGLPQVSAGRPLVSAGHSQVPAGLPLDLRMGQILPEARPGFTLVLNGRRPSNLDLDLNRPTAGPNESPTKSRTRTGLSDPLQTRLIPESLRLGPDPGPNGPMFFQINAVQVQDQAQVKDQPDPALKSLVPVLALNQSLQRPGPDPYSPVQTESESKIYTSKATIYEISKPVSIQDLTSINKITWNQDFHKTGLKPALSPSSDPGITSTKTTVNQVQVSEFGPKTPGLNLAINGLRPELNMERPLGDFVGGSGLVWTCPDPQYLFRDRSMESRPNPELFPNTTTLQDFEIHRPRPGLDLTKTLVKSNQIQRKTASHNKTKDQSLSNKSPQKSPSEDWKLHVSTKPDVQVHVEPTLSPERPTNTLDSNKNLLCHNQDLQKPATEVFFRSPTKIPSPNPDLGVQKSPAESRKLDPGPDKSFQMNGSRLRSQTRTRPDPDSVGLPPSLPNLPLFLSVPVIDSSSCFGPGLKADLRTMSVSSLSPDLSKILDPGLKSSDQTRSLRTISILSLSPSSLKTPDPILQSPPKTKYLDPVWTLSVGLSPGLDQVSEARKSLSSLLESQMKTSQKPVQSRPRSMYYGLTPAQYETFKGISTKTWTKEDHIKNRTEPSLNSQLKPRPGHKEGWSEVDLSKTESEPRIQSLDLHSTGERPGLDQTETWDRGGLDQTQTWEMVYTGQGLGGFRLEPDKTRPEPRQEFAQSQTDLNGNVSLVQDQISDQTKSTNQDLDQVPVQRFSPGLSPKEINATLVNVSPQETREPRPRLEPVHGTGLEPGLEPGLTPLLGPGLDSVLDSVVLSLSPETSNPDFEEKHKIYKESDSQRSPTKSAKPGLSETSTGFRPRPVHSGPVSVVPERLDSVKAAKIHNEPDLDTGSKPDFSPKPDMTLRVQTKTRSSDPQSPPRTKTTPGPGIKLSPSSSQTRTDPSPGFGTSSLTGPLVKTAIKTTISPLKDQVQTLEPRTSSKLKRGLMKTGLGSGLGSGPEVKGETGLSGLTEYSKPERRPSPFERPGFSTGLETGPGLMTSGLSEGLGSRLGTGQTRPSSELESTGTSPGPWGQLIESDLGHGSGLSIGLETGLGLKTLGLGASLDTGLKTSEFGAGLGSGLRTGQSRGWSRGTSPELDGHITETDLDTGPETSPGLMIAGLGSGLGICQIRPQAGLETTGTSQGLESGLGSVIDSGSLPQASEPERSRSSRPRPGLDPAQSPLGTQDKPDLVLRKAGPSTETRTRTTLRDHVQKESSLKTKLRLKESLKETMDKLDKLLDKKGLKKITRTQDSLETWAMTRSGLQDSLQNQPNPENPPRLGLRLTTEPQTEEVFVTKDSLKTDSGLNLEQIRSKDQLWDLIKTEDQKDFDKFLKTRSVAKSKFQSEEGVDSALGFQNYTTVMDSLTMGLIGLEPQGTLEDLKDRQQESLKMNLTIIKSNGTLQNLEQNSMDYLDKTTPMLLDGLQDLVQDLENKTLKVQIQTQTQIQTETQTGLDLTGLKPGGPLQDLDHDLMDLLDKTVTDGLPLNSMGNQDSLWNLEDRMKDKITDKNLKVQTKTQTRTQTGLKPDHTLQDLEKDFRRSLAQTVMNRVPLKSEVTQDLERDLEDKMEGNMTEPKILKNQNHTQTGIKHLDQDSVKEKAKVMDGVSLKSMRNQDLAQNMEETLKTKTRIKTQTMTWTKTGLCSTKSPTSPASSAERPNKNLLKDGSSDEKPSPQTPNSTKSRTKFKSPRSLTETAALSTKLSKKFPGPHVVFTEDHVQTKDNQEPLSKTTKCPPRKSSAEKLLNIMKKYRTERESPETTLKTSGPSTKSCKILKIQDFIQTAEKPDSLTKPSSDSPPSDPPKSTSGPAKDKELTSGQAKDQDSTSGPPKDQETTSDPAKDPESTYGPAKDQETTAGPAKDQESPYGPAKDQDTTSGPAKDPESTFGPAKDQRKSGKTTLLKAKTKGLASKVSGWTRLKKHMVVEQEEPNFPGSDPDLGFKPRSGPEPTAGPEPGVSRDREVQQMESGTKALKMWDAVLFHMFSTKERIIKQIQANQNQHQDKNQDQTKTPTPDQETPSFVNRLPVLLYSPRFDARKLKEAAEKPISKLSTAFERALIRRRTSEDPQKDFNRTPRGFKV